MCSINGAKNIAFSPPEDGNTLESRRSFWCMAHDCYLFSEAAAAEKMGKQTERHVT